MKSSVYNEILKRDHARSTITPRSHCTQFLLAREVRSSRHATERKEPLAEAHGPLPSRLAGVRGQTNQSSTRRLNHKRLTNNRYIQHTEEIKTIRHIREQISVLMMENPEKCSRDEPQSRFGSVTQQESWFYCKKESPSIETYSGEIRLLSKALAWLCYERVIRKSPDVRQLPPRVKLRSGNVTLVPQHGGGSVRISRAALCDRS